jgi:hypothetical protein
MQSFCAAKMAKSALIKDALRTYFMWLSFQLIIELLLSKASKLIF